MREAVGIPPVIQGHVIRKMRRIAPTFVAAVLAIAYLIVDPTGADLPAQLFRAKLFGVEGFGIWNNWWYAGHNVTGYSVLFPALAWLTSPQLVAALASVGTAAAFEAIAHDSFGEDAWLGATWLGAATVTELLSGRLTFAFGLCGAMLTALALVRRRSGLALLVALLTALASPVAALFAALAGATAIFVPGMRRTGAGVILAALVPVLALAIVFPEGGSQPFAFSTLWPLLVAGAFLVGATYGADSTQRGGGRGAVRGDGRIDSAINRTTVITVATILYAAGCLLAYGLSTPVGSNAARLGELVAGPLAALLLVSRRAYRPAITTMVLAISAVPLTYIQVREAIGDLQHGWRAPYDGAAYYRPLIGFLGSQPGAREHSWRIEVPFTQGHWEADRLAPEFALARGWERQLDIADDSLFYGAKLDASSYRSWLSRLAVRYVAVAAPSSPASSPTSSSKVEVKMQVDAPADYSARAELRLIGSGLPYLKRVATLKNWIVYEVADPTPIVTGAAEQTGMGANWLKLTFTRPGSALIRVRFSPYWKLSGVRGCVAPAGDFTRISAMTAGRASLTIAFALGRIGARSRRCD